jgi:uncharacterized protein with NAD-binding domain and iron-sulfur cluster
VARRERIVILGGGIAALAAAFELSRPGWRKRYETITIYQQGWRLGGKGASGRGRHGRIEEHGLHLWLGFYENAFRLIRDCYEELNRPPTSPLAVWRDAFKKASFVVVEDWHDGTWKHWPIWYPENNQLPGDRRTAPLPTMWGYVQRLMQVLQRLIGEGRGARVARPRRLARMSAPRSDKRARVVLRALTVALGLAKSLPRDALQHSVEQHEILIRHLDQFLASWCGQPGMDDDARRTGQLLDLIVANIRGILRDGLLVRPLDTIDRWDYRDWLRHHGASPDSLSSAILRGGYDLAFAYAGGDPRRPALAAGQALGSGLRFYFTYKGAIFWKMQAGMGDVMFAPLYQVLKRRGVRFQFFHRVDDLRLSMDHASIAGIELGRQVDLVNPSLEYDPLVEVGGLPCWPAEPRWEQICGDPQVRNQNFESFWAPWQDAGKVTLKAGEDFDRVIFGISLGAVPYLCQELVADSQRWRDMVDNVQTVQTQAFQVWLSADATNLGWKMQQADLSSYVTPFDTWADMRQLIVREQWPRGLRPRNIGYFCSVMTTPRARRPRPDPSFPPAAAAEVKANAIDFLCGHVPHLWPRAIDRRTREFRWDLLVGDQGVGIVRFDSQFWRANINPSDRYVQAVPESNQYRLKPDQAGYDNLYVVGDWTDCGLNVGCVEAAVMSGLLASNAVSGLPPLATIVGYAQP